MPIIDLDKSDEEILDDYPGLKELQQLGRRLFLLREAAYQRRLALQVEVDKKLQEEQRLESERLAKEIADTHDAEEKEKMQLLRDAIIQKLKEEGKVVSE